MKDKRKKKSRTRKVARTLKEAAFPSSDALLEAAREMFLLRKKVSGAREELDDESGAERRKKAASLRRLVRAERSWTRSWHRCFNLTGDGLDLCRRGRRLRLNRMEREILAGLVLGKLGLIDDLSKASCKDLLEFLDPSGKKALDALRSVSEKGRLFRAKLIAHEDLDEELSQRILVLDPVLLDTILFERRRSRSDVAGVTQDGFYRRLADLTVAYRNKARELDYVISGYGSASDHFKCCRQAERVRRALEEILELHPDWALSRCLRAPGLARNPHNRTIFLILLGKEFCNLDADDYLFWGEGLALAVAGNHGEFFQKLKLLHPRSELLRRGHIRPCLGEEDGSEVDLESIRKTEFELGDRSLQALGIKRKRFKKREFSRVRKPKVQLKQLVLSAPVRRSLDMAVAQARHAGVLTRKWGLGETITYGRAVTVLFSGPPGVGKTACAEAMAQELGKPILAIDYSQIQNCWVGETEKNIVSAFRTARKYDAVLFWDEADAMFYNRDNTRQSFEVRFVNVLLQEVEKFEGMCVLATNRKISLDPALERRISLRVEFERPDRGMRVEIWKRLLPERLPMGEDVDIERLAGEELTGGEIKNVVLNAARLALVRGARGPVTMGDFLEALGMERAGRWSGGRGRIGFLKPDTDADTDTI